MDVTATPNPVEAGEPLTFSACGFEILAPVSVHVNGEQKFWIGMRSTTNGNCLDNNVWVFESAGEYQVELFQDQAKGQGRGKSKSALVGACTVAVTS